MNILWFSMVISKVYLNACWSKQYLFHKSNYDNIDTDFINIWIQKQAPSVVYFNVSPKYMMPYNITNTWTILF